MEAKRRLFAYLIIFIFGGLLYNVIEIIFRQYTHISMFFAGGLCLVLIALSDELTAGKPFVLKVIIGGLIITAVEFVFGVMLNLVLGLNVWDYSYEPYNLLGQICLSFSLMWFFLSVPAIWLSRFIRSVFELPETF